MELGDVSGIALDYRLDDRGFKSQQRLGIFLFTTAHPIQWVPEAPFLGVKHSGR
jgi:hypothetical protein